MTNETKVRANRMSVRAHPIECRLFCNDKRPPYTGSEYSFINGVFLSFNVKNSRRDYRICCRTSSTKARPNPRWLHQRASEWLRIPRISHKIGLYSKLGRCQ